MTFRKSILLLIALSTIGALVACSSSSSHPTIITVTLSAVSTPLAVNSQTAITATTNDTAGVTWSCTPAGSCGTFAPSSTLSGAATTYTAPAIATSNVVITATSVTDPAKSASTSAITIAGATLADGNYVFSLFGSDAISFQYSLSGVFTVAGGAITGGEQDFVDFANFTESDLINPTGSSVITAADGNLQITLATCLGADCTQIDTNVGVAGIETLAGSVLPLNPNKALITEFDSSASSSGELSLQDPTAIATPSGGYAFGLNGVDLNFCQVAFGGVINIDGSGTISGAGSIFDANDCASGTAFQAETFNASTVSAPDTLGRVVFTLNPTDTLDFPQIVLIGYIVDANKIQLVEGFDSFIGTTGGTAFSQGANTGAFTATSVSGNSYVVGLIGFDTVFVLQTAGVFTFNADGSISGFMNYNDTSGVGVQAPSALTGGAWVEDVGTGRVTLTGVTDGIITFNAQVDLDGNGDLLALSMDASDILQGRGFQQSGGGAFTAGSFSGAYGVGATGYDFLFDEYDAVGPVAADGAGAFAGFTDLNWLLSAGPTYPDQTVSGTFTADPSGVFTGTITGLDLTNASNSDAFSYYLIDPTGDNIAIETDPNQVTFGYFLQQ